MKNREKDKWKAVDGAIGETENEERIGFVVMCSRLNVRESPSMDAEVLTILNVLDEVIVHGEEETEDKWYCVEVNGVVGYCKAEFIELLE